MSRPEWLTGANGISLLRIPCIVFAVKAIIDHQFQLAAVWVLVGLLTDFLDGFVAKRGWLGGVSTVGKWLDPLLDKPMIFIPLAAVGAAQDRAGHSDLALAVLVTLIALLFREAEVFLMKKDMARFEGIKSAGEHGRASLFFQGGATLLLIMNALGDRALVGAALGTIVTAAYLSGWVYFTQWRAHVRDRYHA